jgi:hypothetical protein
MQKLVNHLGRGAKSPEFFLYFRRQPQHAYSGRRECNDVPDKMSTHEVHDAYIAGAARIVTQSKLETLAAEGKASRIGMQQVDFI